MIQLVRSSAEQTKLLQTAHTSAHCPCFLIFATYRKQHSDVRGGARVIPVVTHYMTSHQRCHRGGQMGPECEFSYISKTSSVVLDASYRPTLKIFHYGHFPTKSCCFCTLLILINHLLQRSKWNIGNYF